MKKEQVIKPFKRKTASVKCFPVQQKITLPLEMSNRSEKYLSPKRITGLDTSFYKRQETLVRSLQQEINKLKLEVESLRKENHSLWEDNMALRKIVEEHSETQRNNHNSQNATFDVLNELKQKIDLLNSDDHLSTFDEIDLQDICNCQKYQAQSKDYKKNIKFLEESLLHSQQIIIKLQDENKKLKLHKLQYKAHYTIKQQLSPSELRFTKSRQKRSRYKISSIQEMIQETDD